MIKKSLLSLAAVLAAIAGTPASAAQPTVLKLEQFRRSVALRVDVAGRERLFQFDTGGGVSFISPAVAEALDCERGARLVGFRMTGDKLEVPRCDDVPLAIAGRRFTIPVAGVADLGELNAKGVSLDGMIALDLFAGKTITIDFAALRLTVETPQSAARRIDGAIELPVKLVREIGGHALAVDVQVPSKAGNLGFQLDSGNGGTLLIAKPYAALFGFRSDAGPQSGSFPLGRGITASGLVFPSGITLDGNLGMPFLKYYVVTMDLRRGRLWLRRNPVAPPDGMGVPPTEAKK